MGKHLLTIIFLLLTCFSTDVFGQKDLRIGEWNIYHPFRYGRHLTQSDEKVYYTSQFAVVAFDKEDLSAKFITKLDGLTNAKTNLIKYSPISGDLLVSYSNSDFDLINEGRTTTYSNLRLDGNFFNRTINDIAILKDSMAYFCTAYGVVEFNLVSERFGFTANLGIEVFNIAYQDEKFYVATEEGIYVAKDLPNINLKDNSNWKLLDINDGFPGDYRSEAIVNYKDQLFMAIDDTLFKYSNGSLDSVYHDSEFVISYLTAEGEHLLLGLYCKEECTGKMIMFDATGTARPGPDNCISRPRYTLEDQKGQLWFADDWWSYRISKSADAPCERILFNAPFNSQNNEIKIHDGEVWVTSEIISSSSYASFNQNHGFYHFKEGKWENINRWNNPEMNLKNGGKNCYTVAINPDNGMVYVGTLSDGLLEYNPETKKIFYYDNVTSSLQVAIGDATVRVGGLAFDDDGNLWMSNNSAGDPIAVLKPDGEMINNFSNKLASGTPLRKLVIDQNGYKWFSSDKQGLVVYDDKGTLENPLDDEVKEFTTSSSLLPDDNVRCIAVDLDGEVWVGTKKGVAIFDCGSVFEDNCRGFKQQVTVGGIPAYLLESEDVLSIAIDGANRKWFGTENGIFVQSPDGKESVAYLTDKNSPLLDNIIYSIAIDPKSGEAFIGTGKGLVSFQTEAIEGFEYHDENNVFAYPNPVRPDYEGPIAIKGLTRDANVKITDVNGQLIFETTALGGQAIWDGRDYTGRKASSGVYLVFSTSADTFGDPDAIVTKILVVN